ncbi:MAG: hypothetical protein LBV53_02525 [Mycoplasmataceae bacterium]|nr:hypothetical protein [Mycoplasmataceae bacterium]
MKKAFKLALIGLTLVTPVALLATIVACAPKKDKVVSLNDLIKNKDIGTVDFWSIVNDQDNIIIKNLVSKANPKANIDWNSIDIYVDAIKNVTISLSSSNTSVYKDWVALQFKTNQINLNKYLDKDVPVSDRSHDSVANSLKDFLGLDPNQITITSNDNYYTAELVAIKNSNYIGSAFINLIADDRVELSTLISYDSILDVTDCSEEAELASLKAKYPNIDFNEAIPNYFLSDYYITIHATAGSYKYKGTTEVLVNYTGAIKDINEVITSKTLAVQTNSFAAVYSCLTNTYHNLIMKEIQIEINGWTATVTPVQGSKVYSGSITINLITQTSVEGANK